MTSHARLSLPALAAFFALSFAAALGGALFPTGAEFAQLQRPFFAPPNWLFGPVWTVLYGLIAWSAWLVWRRVGWWGPPMRMWYVQLALNAVWTPLFFGLGWRGVALVEMALLWVAILRTIVLFKPHSRAAGWMLAPYLAWVSFALVLNAAFWWLNR